MIVRFQLPPHSAVRSFYGERDGRMNVTLAFVHNNLLTGANIHTDMATFVHSATRSVDVCQSDGYRPDISRKPTEGEMDAPRNVLVQIGGKFDPAGY